MVSKWTRFLNKLKRKRVHPIDEFEQTQIHRSYATFCEPFPATSTTIAEGLKFQQHISADLSDHSFAFNVSSGFLDQQNFEFSSQTKMTFERSFRRYFADARLFSMQNVRCNTDAYNGWVRLKHSRDTLQQMINFCARQNQQLDGCESLMDIYFRCFYDFLTSCMNELERSFPGLHAYHSHRQSSNTPNAFRSVRMPRKKQVSISSSSGYNSFESSGASLNAHRRSIFVPKQSRYIGAISEWEEQELRLQYL